MKSSGKSLLIAISMALLITLGCGGGGSAPKSSSSNEWIWMSGSNTINAYGTYGAIGVGSVGNTPGARVGPATWTDEAGDLWLFGGYGLASPNSGGDLNDLWKYSNGQWIWMGGSNQTEQTGVYGAKGVASPTNFPGARWQPTASWVDAQGSFWLFGGLGMDSTGKRGNLNDIWKYSNGEWTWVAGLNTAADNVAGIYGVQGVSSPNNFPGTRFDSASWTDKSGNLWLFGGEGWDAAGELTLLNDLWKYSDGEWTWMGGSQGGGAFGVYGTLGVPSASNMPGARTSAVTWIDADGNLWLFGGQGQDANGIICSTTPGPCLLNDLWRYSNGQWTWVGGSNIVDAPGNYGTQGVAASTNFPGARWLGVSWMEPNGDVWLFGGIGFDSTTGAYTVFGDLNDLWKYSGGQWTWMGGSNKGGAPGIYGTQGVASVNNIPGERDDFVGWTDKSGNLWLFGGETTIGLPPVGKWNDLWKYQP